MRCRGKSGLRLARLCCYPLQVGDLKYLGCGNSGASAESFCLSPLLVSESVGIQQLSPNMLGTHICNSKPP